MVYWADLLYKVQQHDDDLFDFDKLYNRQPYTSGPKKLKTYGEGFLDKIRAEASTFAGAAVDFVKQQFGMDGMTQTSLGEAIGLTFQQVQPLPPKSR